MTETILNHHLFRDLRIHRPASIINKYFATVAFTCKTSGKKMTDK